MMRLISSTRNFDFGPVAFRRQISTVHHSNGIVGQCCPTFGLTIVVDTFHEVLQLLRVTVHPILVRSRVAPALFGPDFFYDVNIFELLFLGIVSSDRVNGVYIATGAMVVGHYLQPVMNSTHNNLSRKNVRDHPILKHKMQLAVVLHILIVGPEVLEVAILRISSHFMDAGADCPWTNRLALGRQPFFLLEVHGSSQRMTSFADNGAPSCLRPDAITRRVRSAVGFFTHHP